MVEVFRQSMGNVTDGDVSVSQLSSLALSPYFYLILCFSYLLSVAFLRTRHFRSTRAKYHYPTRTSFASMTNQDAYLIQLGLSELEFPFMFNKSLQFALFRTYGIPTISKLLVQTSQFSGESTATKRYADTALLIAEFMGYHPTSTRSIEAIGRMNYIHSQYQKAGKILDDDLLYTLALFAGEPTRWIDKYEWRKLEDFEKCAVGTFWKAIGDAMGISFRKLRSGEGAGWVDGLQWFDELKEWSAEYEKSSMVPDLNNQKTAEQTVAILLYSIPGFAKGEGSKIVSTLMDDRLRTAMMYEKPSQFYFALVSALFTVRKLVVRYLMYPRPDFLRVHYTTHEPSPAGTFYMTVYESHPWYVKPGIWNRFEPRAWISWMMGLPIPGDDGDKYWPNGYKIPEVGPEYMRGKGREYMKASQERLIGERMRRCPFGRPKKE